MTDSTDLNKKPDVDAQRRNDEVVMPEDVPKILDLVRFLANAHMDWHKKRHPLTFRHFLKRIDYEQNLKKMASSW